MKRLSRIGKVALGLLLVAAPVARAAEVWTSIASECGVDESSLGLYQHVGPQLTFNPAASGTIVARCNVTNPKDFGGNPGWTQLELVYRDPDGPAAPTRVRAKLYRVSNLGVVTVIKSVSSQSHPASGAIQQQLDFFNHSFDFFNNAYFVEILVQRGTTNASDNPTAVLVRLAPPPPV